MPQAHSALVQVQPVVRSASKMRVSGALQLFSWLILLSVSLVLSSSASGASRQVFHRQVPAAVASLSALSPLADTNTLKVVVALPFRNQDALSNLVRQVSDPGSPNYRHYLKPAEFAQQFGPTEADYHKVIAHAKAHGLEVSHTHPNRMLVDLKGPADKIEKMFGVKMHVYKHPKEDRTFFAPNTAPSLDLDQPVLGISGLNNYARPLPRWKRSSNTNSAAAKPNLGSGPEGCYMGVDFRAAYVPGSPLTGIGQSVGLLQFDGYDAADITYYENRAGLRHVPLRNVLLDGFDGSPSGWGGEVEVCLDIQTVISLAPALSQVIVYMAGPWGDWYDILNAMANDTDGNGNPAAYQFSCSWYQPEAPADPVADQIFMQMAAQGQSFFNASGDYCAYTGPISFPGDTPYLTQVGGTTLSTTGPGGALTSETAWNWGNGIGTAGGVSTYYPIPSWQAGVDMSLNNGSTTMRNTPDVALTADNIYVRSSAQDYIVGGTSAAAPLWAAFAALVNQQAAAFGTPALGFANPVLYALATNNPSCFRDTITGDNTSSSSPTNYYAVPGFDLCTGWGTPVGNTMIDALAPGATTAPPTIVAQPQSQTITEGHSTILSVAALGATPITYQWKRNGTALAGATGTSLILNNVTLANAGTYSVNMVNAYGSTSTAPSVLTVTTATCIAGSAGLVSWWNGENSTADATGSNPGTLQGGAAYGAGIVGQNGFSFNGSGHVQIPASTSLNVGVAPTGAQGGAFTLEAWVYPTGPGALFAWTNAADQTYTRLAIEEGGVLFGGLSFGSEKLDHPTFNGSVDWNCYQHIAMVFDDSMRQGSFRLYVNGIEIYKNSYEHPWSPDIWTIGTSGNLHMGESFIGRIDEPAIYNRALASNEIAAIYQASVAGRCATASAPSIATQPQSQTIIAGHCATFTVAAAGSDTNCVSYQWKCNGVNISGATSTSFVAVNTSSTSTYSVLVANRAGATSSVGAVLTVIQPAPIAGTNGLVSWWQGEDNGADVMCLNAGTPEQNVSFGPGFVGRSFHFESWVGMHGWTDVLVPESPSLNIGQGGHFTVEAWVTQSEIKLWDWPTQIPFQWTGGAGFEIRKGGSLFGFVPVSPQVVMTCTSAPGAFATNTYQHVAMTFDYNQAQSNIWLHLYINATEVASQVLENVNYQVTPGTTGDLYLGQNCNGEIDEPCIYNRCLSQSEILAIYNASTAGRLSRAPESIAVQPSSQTVIQGHHATFTSAFGGFPTYPLNYQWRFNGMDIPGATGSDFSVANATSANAGSYSVAVFNDVGWVVSPDAILSVSPATCTPAPSGLVSWWQGERNGVDAMGLNSTDMGGDVGWNPGHVGDSLRFYGIGQITVPASTTLDVGANNAFTIEGWIKCPESYNELLFWPGDTTVIEGLMLSGWGKELSGWIQVGPDYNAVWFFGSVEAPSDSFQHFALTYADVNDNAVVRLFMNGTVVDEQSIDHPGEIWRAKTIGDLVLGNNFNGYIDELSIYNRALSPAEVLAIYSASVAGKCPISPSILSQPQGQTVIEGHVAALQVQAAGTQPLTYQWKLNGYDVDNATDSAYVHNMQLSDAGTYTVEISNAAGTVTSSSATLTVTPAVCISAPAGVVSWWQAENNAFDSMGRNHGFLFGEAGYTRGIAGKTFTFHADEHIELGRMFVPASDSLDIGKNGAFTVEAWASMWWDQPLLSWYRNNAGSVFFDVVGNGALSARVSVTPTEVITCESTPGVVGFDSFQHVAMTYAFDAVQDKAVVTLYANGVKVGETEASHAGHTEPWIAGTMGDLNVGWCMNGEIDELSVYNRALSASEITSIYNASVAGKCPIAPTSVVIQPANQTVVEGLRADLAAVVVGPGSYPLTYQWTHNGEPMAVAASSFAMTAAPGDAGTYSVYVANSAGSATSPNATLNVTAPVCANAPSGLVSWWQGEGNGNDVMGRNTAVLENGVNYEQGYVGQNFSWSGGGRLRIPASESLNVGASGAFTLEAWVKRPQYDWNVLFEWPGNEGWNGVNMWLMDRDMSQPGGIYGGINFTSGEYMYFAAEGDHILTPDFYQHIVLTYNDVSSVATAKLYVNGVKLTESTYPHPGVTLTPNTLGDLYIGQCAGSKLDEIAIYNRALSQAEISNLYNTSTLGKCPVPPSIATQPQSQTVIQGHNARFSVVTVGTQPLSYQWKRDGSDIPGATDSAFVVANVTPDDAGAYSVVVAGTVTSATATLTVAPAVCISAPAGLVSWWQAEENSFDSMGLNRAFLSGEAYCVDGFAGKSFWFHADEHIEIGQMTVPASDSLNIGKDGAFTVEAWVKMYWDQPLLDWYSAAGSVYFDVSGDGALSARVSVTPTCTINCVSASGAVGFGSFEHVAMTYAFDSVQDKAVVTLYVNGVKVGETEASHEGWLEPWVAGTMGNLNVGWGMNGYIDELSLYNRALPVSEIVGIYNASVAGKCPIAPAAVAIQPASQTVVEGLRADLAAVVIGPGSYPLSYQWTHNGTPTTVSSSSFALKTTVADAGTYSVHVANSAGSATSTDATLTVLPATCTTAPSGLVSWWQGEDNGNDAMGRNTATVEGNVSYSPGMVGQTFSMGPGGRLRVPANPTINLGVGGAFTLEAWVRRQPSDWNTLFEWPGQEWDGVNLWLCDREMSQPGGIYGGIFFTEGDYMYIAAPGDNILTPDFFQHIVLTYQDVNNVSIAKVYVNGVKLTESTLPHPGRTLTPNTSGDLSIGQCYVGNELDEVGIYNRALSEAEIVTLYNASTAGKCAQAPSGLTIQPSAQTVVQGHRAVFNAVTAGTRPMTYQWKRNDSDIPGATDAAYVIPNTILDDAASYSVVVANSAGTLASSSALLTVTPATCACAPSGLVSWWQGENSCNDVMALNHGYLWGPVADYCPGFIGNSFTFGLPYAGMEVWGNMIVPASTSLDVGQGGSFTLEAWVNPGTTIDRGSGGSIFQWWNPEYREGVNFWIDDNGILHARVPTSWADILECVSGPVIKLDEFQHVAMTCSHETGDVYWLRLYVNGAEVASTSLNGNGAWLIGTAGDLTMASGYYGKIDDPAIYNVALSAEQIAAIYNASLAGKCAAAPTSAAISPASQTVIQGHRAVFAALAAGTQPMTYQWKLNDSDITGATDSAYVIANTTLADAGSYTVVVGNTAGSTTSSAATLAITPANCVSAQSGLVSWWQGENNCNDVMGLNHGYLWGPVADYCSAFVGNGFAFGLPYCGMEVWGEMQVPASPSLDVAQGGSFTLEAWVNPGSTLDRDSGGGIFRWWNLNYNDGVSFSIDGYGRLWGHIPFSSSIAVDCVSIPAITLDAYQHVAMTCSHVSENSYQISLYVNGVEVGNRTVNGNGGTIIGTAGDLTLASGYYGKIDDPAIYNVALSAEQITAIYEASVAGKCAVAPTSVAITPASQTVIQGHRAVFTAVATGTEPMTYQWKLNGSDISGATGSACVIANTALTDAGTYTVVVVNGAGTTTSSGATLAITPASCISAQSGLVSWWQGENNCNDVMGLNHGYLWGPVADYCSAFVGNGFAFGLPYCGMEVWGEMQVPASPSLDVAQGGSFTLEAWVNPGSTLDRDSGGGIFRWWNLSYNDGVSFSIDGYGRLWGHIPFSSSVAVDCISVPAITLDAYQHVAMTCSQVSENSYQISLYVNGVEVGNRTVNGNGGTIIGTAGDLTLSSGYYGKIDDPAIYNVALSAAQIAAIYDASVAGRCPIAPSSVVIEPASVAALQGQSVTLFAMAAGTSPMTYQWKFNGANIANATSQSLTINNIQPANAGVYSVTVANAAGSATSTGAPVTVNSAPTLTLGNARVTEQVINFETITDYANDNVMFRWPYNSGSTSAFVDTTQPMDSLVVTTFPAGNPNGNGGKVLRADWTFKAATNNPWLRLTTCNALRIPNPVFSFTGKIRFDIYTSRSIKLAVGLRETGTSLPIGSNGGVTGAIEWVGATSKTLGAPNCTRTISAGAWTTVEFDLATDPRYSFNGGNGYLNGTQGVLEHLAIVPNAGLTNYTIYVDNFQMVSTATLPSQTVTMNNNSMLIFTGTATDPDAGQTLSYSLDSGAPSGATINPSTGVFNWTPNSGQAGQTYSIVVRASDNGVPSHSNAKTVTVTVNADPLGVMSADSSAFEQATGGKVVLSWPAVSGTTYQVQYKQGTDGEWTDLGAPIQANSAEASIEISEGDQETEYRIIDLGSSISNQ